MKLLTTFLLAASASLASAATNGLEASPVAMIAAVSIQNVPSIPIATEIVETDSPSASPAAESATGSQAAGEVGTTTPAPTVKPISTPTVTTTVTPKTSNSSSAGPAASTTAEDTPSPSLTASATDNSTVATVGKGTNPLVIKGFRFFDSVTGEYFPMRGVNYYPRPNDGPLDANNLDFFSDEFRHVWERDLPEFVALSANAIRLYAVDPAVDHSAFMCALQAEGIYVIVDLGSSCQGCEITADEAPACYPASYKVRGEKIIAEFAKYDNVIGFSGGNEINHRTGGNPWTWNAPCQKKFIRDMRAFIQSCPSMRKVPVGVVMADTDRDENAQYYNCRTDEEDELENVEWYGINVYVHCEDIDDPAKAAGFNLLRDSFESYKYSVPALLTEFGCLAPSFPTIDGYEAQRTFHDAKWMNDRDYSDYFGGGFVFEYTTENANSKTLSAYPFTTFGAQNYGLGYLSPEDCDDVPGGGNNCSFERFPNFEALAKSYASYVSKDEPTMDTFTVPKDRSQPSTCPKGSPELSKYTWESDSQESLVCPTEGRYQCPAVPTNARSNYTSDSGSGATKSKKKKSKSSRGSKDEDEDGDVNVGDEDSDHDHESTGELDLDEIDGSESESASGSSKKSSKKSAATIVRTSVAVVVPVVALLLSLLW
jgi:hypothetical protein